MHAAVWLVNVNLASTLLCQKGAIQLTAPSSVANPDLQIRRGPGHPEPEIRGGGGGLRKNFFDPSGIILVEK